MLLATALASSAFARAGLAVQNHTLQAPHGHRKAGCRHSGHQDAMMPVYAPHFTLYVQAQGGVQGTGMSLLLLL